MRTRVNSTAEQSRGRRPPLSPFSGGKGGEEGNGDEEASRAKLTWPWNLASLVLFLVCFSMVLYMLYSRLVAELDTLEGNTEPIRVPKSLKDIQETQHTLRLLLDANSRLVVVAFGALYLFKQTFSLPGSALLNITAGLMLGVPFGWPLVCLLSASGATLAYLVSWLVAEEMVLKVGPHSTGRIARALHKLQEKSERLKEEPLTFLLYLTSLRLFPGSPNWLLNALLPHCGVPVQLFFVSVFVGLMPYNFVTVSAGNVLASVESTADIFDTTLLLKLTGAAVLLAGFAPTLKWVQTRFGFVTNVE